MPITTTSLTYRGAFRVPTDGAWQQNLVLEYGGTAIAYNPANNSLFMVGHDQSQCIAEISIPAPKIGAINTLNRATMLQMPRIVPTQNNGNLASETKIGGLFVFNGNLYGTKYEYYDGDGNGRHSHFKLTGTNLNQTAQGLFELSAPGGGWVGGYIGEIPTSKRSLFGNKTHFCGLGSIPIISRTSSGPAAFAFNLADVGVVNPVPTVPMVGYPLANALGGSPTNGANTLYTIASTIRGAVFPDSDTVLFFGSHGKGAYCYGSDTACGDPANPYQGTHAYPYVPYVWAYSVTDLADVAAGRKQNYQITPTVWETPNFYSYTDDYRGCGAAFDSATNTLYVVEGFIDGAYPVVHVYTVNVGAPVDTTPPVISNVQVSNLTQTGATISWTTNELSDTRVEYGPTTSYGTILVQADSVTNHSFALTGLTAGTVYNFRVKSWDNANPRNSATSANFTFSTAAVVPPTIVNVSTISQLEAAISNLSNGQTINIADGTYTLRNPLYFPVNVSGVTISGGGVSKVTLDGANSVQFGFWLSSNPNTTIKNMTIKNIAQHCIIANYGAHNLTCDTLNLVDCGDQFIKSNPGGTDLGNNNGIVKNCTIGYTTNAPDDYTNGVDVHGGQNWSIIDNIFYNIVHPTLLCGPAVLAWNHSQNTSIQRNKFINCARDISLGLILRNGTSDHVGGLVCNNTSTRTKSGTYDVPIGVMDCPNANILHNTILCGNYYPNSIEYRFARTTGTLIGAILTDKPIVARDGAIATLLTNQLNATPGMFVDSVNDLHLKPGTVVQTVGKLTLVPEDMDKMARSNTTMVGSDEITVTVNPCQMYIDQLATANATIATLTSQLSTLQATYDNILLDRNNLQIIVTSLTNQNSQLTITINNLNGQVTQLTGERDSLQALVDIQIGTINNLTQALDNLQASYDLILSRNNDLVVENGFLAQKLADLKAELTNLAAAI